MAEVTKLREADLVVLYTNIGRGHPNYLDGIIDVLHESYPDRPYLKTDVFAVSCGLSLTCWNLVKKFYSWGGRGGIITALYDILRRISGSGDGGGLLYNLLGRDLKKYLSGYTRPVIVAHPIIARILSDQNQVIYQHGELAAPEESFAGKSHTILIPNVDTAEVFRRANVDNERLVITGQCIETDLVPLAGDAFMKRQERLKAYKPMIAALFSSGAYPGEHLHKLRSAAISLYQAGHQVVLFLGSSKKIRAEFEDYFRHENIDFASDLGGSVQVKVIHTVDRQEENQKVASVFNKLDFFIAPAHERTNWAVGLGLPQFILTPHIGSYAPLNAAIALARNVACEIDDNVKAKDFGGIVSEFRQDGRLLAMSRNGFGHTEILGFKRIAKSLFGDI